MPPKPLKAAMTKQEFRRLLDRLGVSPTAAAEKLRVGRSTVWRWLNGKTPISEKNVILIRSALKTGKS